MKKNIALAVIALFLMNYSSLLAENYPFSVGLFATGKGSVNSTDPINGQKVGWNLVGAPDLGLTAYIPFAEGTKIGLTFDIASSNISYNLHKWDDANISSDIDYSYFSFAPSLYIYGFTIGIGYNLPIDVTSGGTLAGIDYTKDNLQSVFDLRFGGMIPLYSNFIGRVNLLVTASYQLNGTFKTDNIPASLTESLNPKPGAVSIGLNYLFHLGNFMPK